MPIKLQCGVRMAAMRHWVLFAPAASLISTAREETRNIMRFPMTATVSSVHERPSGFFAAIAKAARRFGATMIENSGGMRCSREAERLFQLSDAELARLGLTRDRIVQHAFARYLTY